MIFSVLIENNAPGTIKPNFATSNILHFFFVKPSTIKKLEMCVPELGNIQFLSITQLYVFLKLIHEIKHRK